MPSPLRKGGGTALVADVFDMFGFSSYSDLLPTHQPAHRVNDGGRNNILETHRGGGERAGKHARIRKKGLQVLDLFTRCGWMGVRATSVTDGFVK
jgi:hypothetical protein